MEETFFLILLVIVMLIGSYVAGSIPLNVNMSEDKLKKVTVFGAGLLVGTALAVIIPEGIRSLLSEAPHRINESAVSTRDGVKVEAASPEQSHTDLHTVIGVSLVLGFVFMLLVDQIATSRNESLHPAERNVTATVGLVVHAAADGIALGAAATTAHADVEIVVFLAIMLHKAPAAFGLVTFLMHEGIERNRIRKHLLIFAIAAPLLTLITYFGIGKESKETLSNINATGIAMLFSAGTFLYVATVHVLPELTHGSQSSTHTLLPTQEGGSPVPSKMKPSGFASLQFSELFILVIGTMLPTLLTMGHKH